MRTFMRLLFACACIAATARAGLAQTQPAPGQQSDQKVVVNASEVLFDVVVRDKKGRPVNDLGASDFEVYEDGVAQQVNSFRLMTRNNGNDKPATNVAEKSSKTENSSKNQAAAQLSSTRGSAEASPRLSAVAIVFDRLTPAGRARASRAALSYVGEKEDLVGVFLTDLSLATLQPYTNDMQLVRKAIENAGTSSPSLYISNNAEARDGRKGLG